MSYKLINLEDAFVTSWAGGSTYQLYIHPEMASYKDRNFDFRISVATADQEISEYTPLPGVTRHLIMLDGTATVYHKDHGSIEMHPYEDIDMFDGGWESYSQGKVTDFNLMLANGWQGRLTVITKSQDICCDDEKSPSFASIYCHRGNAEVYLDDEKLLISDGDMVILEDFFRNINVIPLAECKLICCHMWKD